MDASRPLLLGLLITSGCASWPDAQPDAITPSLRTVSSIDVRSEPRCECPPTVEPLGDAVVVLDACTPVVALYRRDVVAGTPPTLVGICDVPCADTAVVSGAVYAYTTAAMSSDGAAGPPSAEFYVTFEPAD